MSLKLAQGFSFFRGGGWSEQKNVDTGSKFEISPTLNIQTDKEIYRPGDSVEVTIEICYPGISNEDIRTVKFGNGSCSLLVDSLSFEVKGIEKLDTQWFATQKPLSGSKQKRGDSSASCRLVVDF